MKPLFYWLLLGGLLLGHLAIAQTAPVRLALPNNTTLKAWKQQRQAVETAIYQQFIFPPECLRYEVDGKVFIRLTIAPAGNVQRIAILKPLVQPFDLAVIRVARRLRFQPRFSEAEAVNFTVSISFEKAANRPIVGQRRSTTKARHRNSTR